jgi:pimeloyl-ACP methyl ester carboxylesterase
MSELAHDAAGEGDPPMLFLHGWCCDRSFLAPQFEHFSARHRTVAVDLPGHGDSAPAGAVTIESLACEVVALMAHLDLGPSVVAGHSMGATVALAVAQAAPERVGAVVMLDPPPLDRDVLAAFAAEWVPAFRAADGEATRRAFIERMFLPTDDADRRADIVKRMCAVPDDVAVPLLGAMGAFDAVTALRACRVPVLVIGSAVPSNGSAFLLEACPDIVIGQAVGAGHFFELEVPDQTNAMIERFLAVRGVSRQ